MINHQKKCVIITNFHESQPGFLDFSYRLASLTKKYQSTIISLAEITQSELMFKETQYKVFPVSEGKLGWITYLIKCAWFIRRHKPDVVVLLHTAVAPISLLVGAIPTCVYWNEHPFNIVRLPKKSSLIRYYVSIISQNLIFLGAKKAHIVMPIGEEQRDDLIARGCDTKRIQMIYMGVAEDFSANTSFYSVSDAPSIRLIYIGTVSKERGRDVMLEAMSLIAKKNISVNLTMVGANTEELSYSMQRIKTLNIENYVRVHARVSGKEIPKYLASADVGICLWEDTPWWRFNPPTKLFEYLVAGIPILASNIRTHTRYIKNWNNGLIFNYDANSLANAIIELYLHKNKIDALKKQASVSGEQYFWSRIEPVFSKTIYEAANL